MVLLVLYVKAELENIGSIKFPANLQYCFDVKDAQSDEEKKGVYMCADEIAEIDGSKGDANFVMRFPDCKKQCTVWEDVDLGADPDGWFEYCEKQGESVGITELAFEFRKQK